MHASTHVVGSASATAHLCTLLCNTGCMLYDLLWYNTALPEECSTSDNMCAVHREAAPADLHALVDGFLSKMEAAAWADREANKQQRPAVAKLGLLPEMQRVFTNKKVHLPSFPQQGTQP